MRFLFLPFLISSAITYILLHYARRIGVSTAPLRSKQSLHAQPAPRIGGFAVLLALLSGATQILVAFPAAVFPLWAAIGGAAGAAIIGLVEDMTGKVRVSIRLLGVAGIATLCTLHPDIRLAHSDMSGLDALLRVSPVFAVLFTAFIITGLTNAFNIIDGLNGLSSACAIIVLASFTYAAYLANDMLVVRIAAITIGALAGFFVWNYPGGFIFLGDGGAYLSGFAVASIGLLLIVRNTGHVSPLFPLLACIYPVAETCFSIYRRGVKRHPISGPDRGHLHSLLFRRLDSPLSRRLQGDNRRRNSGTTPYLWALCLGSVIPAILFHDDFWALLASIATFIALYIWLYLRIVRFKTPKWL